MRVAPSVIIRGNLQIILELIDPDRVADSNLIDFQDIDFQGFTTKAAKKAIIIRKLHRLSYPAWKDFLKYLRRDSYIPHNELGKLLCYVINRPT